MAVSKNEYTTRYKKEHLKRVPFEIRKEFYETLKAAADSCNMSVNGFIKDAVKEKMERDKMEREKMESEKVAC